MSWLDRHSQFRRLLAISALAVAAATWQPYSVFSSGPGENDEEGDALLSFSTVGDSRQDPASPDPSTTPVSGQDTIWLENTKAWSRIIRSIQAQKSNFLFFDGDMIMGYGEATVPPNNATVDGIVNSDLMQFYRQYGFWRGMVTGLMETGTYVVPVPGNHETQCKACGKKAKQVNEDAWRANMGDLILDEERFQSLFGEKPADENIDNPPGTPDLLTSNQRQLSYSFDFRGFHFAVINTDPVGNDAHAPTQWLADDLAAAQGRGVNRFFVFGHKPAFTYYFGMNMPDKPSGLDNDIPSRDAFWDVIEKYGAVYFCGHEHIFNISQPRAGKGGKAWQVLVGSGGSPFEAPPNTVTANPQTDRDYAWVTVKILKNGKEKIKAYGFDDQFGPTRLIESRLLAQ